MSIQSIQKQIFERSKGDNRAPSHSFSYRGTGTTVVHTRSITSESDYTNEAYARISYDNRKTWTPWEDVYQELIRPKDQGEILWTQKPDGIYNPVHDHYVAMNMQRLFPNGHVKDYHLLWNGQQGCIDHTFLHVSKDLETWLPPQLVRYEEGSDYDEDHWLNPLYTRHNLAYAGCNLIIDAHGDILFPVGARMDACCRILGIDTREVFPSCPHIANGLIVFRGTWNESNNQYDLIPSEPVVISDLKSSRGIDEPTIVQLKNGRIVVVFRGANTNMPAWRTRLKKGTPAHKWYTYSDDQGRTWTDPVPYHFDNRELIYSPASISLFFCSIANGHAYWIGNITPPETVGSYPREPLCIAQVDENTGLLMKDTYRIIDRRDQATESAHVQLSNFSIFQDRQTKAGEIYLSKIETDIKQKFNADAWKYTLEFGP